MPKYNKFRYFTIALWIAAIGSCAAGDGLKDAGVAGWGSGLMYLGTALVLYLMFVHDFNEPL